MLYTIQTIKECNNNNTQNNTKLLFYAYFWWYIALLTVYLAQLINFIICKGDYTENDNNTKLFVILKYLLAVGFVCILGFSFKTYSTTNNLCVQQTPLLDYFM